RDHHDLHSFPTRRSSDLMPGLSEEQVMQQQSMQKMMGILSPVMIFIASMATASALSLYWAVSGIFLIGQTYITRKMYPIPVPQADRKSTRLNSSHVKISY